VKIAKYKRLNAPDIIGKRRGNLVNIAKKIEAYLPDKLLALVKAAGELAAERGERLYLVGGVVRDIFMGRPNLDLDLVVEGDALSLARQLAKSQKGKVLTHARFGTATLKKDEISVDLATARSETYAEPGALPTVKPGTIRDDLLRRDFTVNAMAVSLNPDSFGELVDPYGGKADLDRGLIRALHQRSFKDDPTRIWRAIRFEQRLGFRMEFDTEVMMRRDVTMMVRVSGDRLRHELERVLEEDYPEKSIYRAGRVGALQQLQPSLEADAWLVRRFGLARQWSGGSKPEPVIYLALLAWRLNEVELKAFIERLKFGGETARVLRDISGIKRAIPSLVAQELKPSEIYYLLERYRPQAIQAAMLVMDYGLVRQRLELYLSTLRFVKPALTGDDLKKMGVPEGRRLGWMLKKLKEARLDGEVKTRQGERALVRKWLGEGKR
jgi:tRNA nucleotidyltransferase (CCA-adding enzyme)